MKVDYLFSRNKKLGSRLISWASKYERTGLISCPSHVAVLMNDELVVESTFNNGVRIIPYKHWLEINEELHRIPCELKHRASKHMTTELTKVWGKKYDWKGVMFFALSYIKLILFRTPLPEKNKWQRDTHYFCTEYVGNVVGQDYSMKSPARLCADWLGI